jgi:ubiquinone/menaquinone biosynthesis C-methylase UbiE
MGKEISTAEVQLCVASKNIPQRPFTHDQLRAFGALAFKEKLVEDWSNEFARLYGAGLFGAEGDRFSLTPEGEAYVEKVVTNEFFGKSLLRAEKSPAFGRFCERVYGMNLSQYGTADMDQIQRLIDLLGLNEKSHVLDAGCGLGATTEYLAFRTGARFTGVDLAEPAIERAAERTRDKSERLAFTLANISDLDLPAASFDAVIAIDTLYFSKDLARTTSRMKSVLGSGGQMGLFMSEFIPPGGPVEQLAADGTRLAQALKQNGLAFEAHDLTESNLLFWRRSVETAKEMIEEFEAEGNKDLCEGRISEGSAVLAMAEAGRMTRYLYHVRV